MPLAGSPETITKALSITMRVCRSPVPGLPAGWLAVGSVVVEQARPPFQPQVQSVPRLRVTWDASSSRARPTPVPRTTRQEQQNPDALHEPAAQTTPGMMRPSPRGYFVASCSSGTMTRWKMCVRSSAQGRRWNRRSASLARCGQESTSPLQARRLSGMTARPSDLAMSMPRQHGAWTSLSGHCRRQGRQSRMLCGHASC